MFYSLDGSNAFGALLALVQLAGVVYALIRLFVAGRASPVWWVLIILFFPFGWAIFLAIDYSQKSKEGDPQAIDWKQPAAIPPPAEAGQTVPIAQSQMAPAQAKEANTDIFKKVGMILGIITLVAGAAFIGFIILFMIALSSWGSNK